MIHFHKYEEIKKEVIYKDVYGYIVSADNDLLDKIQTYIYYRCTKCGKRKLKIKKGDWT